MKKQFVPTHTFPQTEIPSLLDRWVKNIPSVKMLYPPKKMLLLIFSLNYNIHVGLLGICQVFSVSCKKCILVGYEKLLFHDRYVFIYCGL